VDLNDLANHLNIMYEMVFDSQSGNWELVLMQDQNMNMVGVAEFTQLQ